ncbi:MAG: hypothetical protein A2V90_03575, partial [Gammaproteobacteria bacterium RBG_16_57_12]
MNIILIRNSQANQANIQLSRVKLLALGALFMVLGPLALVYLGFQWGQLHGEVPPAEMQAQWDFEADKYRQELAAAKQQAQNSLSALAMRLGQLQGHIIRLDALGQRLTDEAGLDKGEFDFEHPPAQGGPSVSDWRQQIGVTDFLASLESLERQLKDRDHQMGALSSLLMNRSVYDEVVPSGRPIISGWISSYFGIRADPFTGQKEMHQGVDFAGKEGSDVLALGSGIVTWADKRFGYGNLVEINHGDGYTTRYGHNKEILVKVGQT